MLIQCWTWLQVIWWFWIRYVYHILLRSIYVFSFTHLFSVLSLYSNYSVPKSCREKYICPKCISQFQVISLMWDFVFLISWHFYTIYTLNCNLEKRNVFFSNTEWIQEEDKKMVAKSFLPNCRNIFRLN